MENAISAASLFLAAGGGGAQTNAPDGSLTSSPRTMSGAMHEGRPRDATVTGVSNADRKAS